MHARNILINALLKAYPAASYDHMTLQEVARTYYLMQGEHPIEIAPWLLSYNIMQGWHIDTRESLNDFTCTVFGY